MKYIVGEGASFIANGRIYKPGDEIDSDFFKFGKTLQAAIVSGKLKPIQDTGAVPPTPAAIPEPVTLPPIPVAIPEPVTLPPIPVAIP